MFFFFIILIPFIIFFLFSYLFTFCWEFKKKIQFVLRFLLFSFFFNWKLPLLYNRLPVKLTLNWFTISRYILFVVLWTRTRFVDIVFYYLNTSLLVKTNVFVFISHFFFILLFNVFLFFKSNKTHIQVLKLLWL